MKQKLILFNDDFTVQSVTEGLEVVTYDLSSVKWSQGELRDVQVPFIVVLEDTPVEDIMAGDILEFYRMIQIKRLNRECEEFIMNGFQSLATNAYYGFTERDQQNFNQQLSLLILDGTIGISEPILWKTEDKGVISHTRDEFIAIWKDGEKHKRNGIGVYWNLKEKLATLQTLDEIKSFGSFETEMNLLSPS